MSSRGREGMLKSSRQEDGIRGGGGMNDLIDGPKCGAIGCEGKR